MEDASIIELAIQNGSIGIAYTYNEPIIWYEYVRHMSEYAHSKGLVNVMVTNGYINEAPMRALLPYIDAMNIDLKAMTNTFYREICGGSLEPVLKTIALCAKHTHVEITNLMIDTLNSDKEAFIDLIDFVASVDDNIPLHISRYFPNHLMTLPPTEIETLRNARDLARAKLKNVYVGNVYIP
jgi:pyruvate formate lyase activating enzyme